MLKDCVEDLVNSEDQSRPSKNARVGLCKMRSTLGHNHWAGGPALLHNITCGEINKLDEMTRTTRARLDKLKDIIDELVDTM